MPSTAGRLCGLLRLVKDVTVRQDDLAISVDSRGVSFPTVASCQCGARRQDSGADHLREVRSQWTLRCRRSLPYRRGFLLYLVDSNGKSKGDRIPNLQTEKAIEFGARLNDLGDLFTGPETVKIGTNVVGVDEVTKSG